MRDLVSTNLRAASLGTVLAVLGLFSQKTALGQDHSVIPVAVQNGKASFDVPLTKTGTKSLVIVSALSTEAGPFKISLSANSTHRTTPKYIPKTLETSPDVVFHAKPPVLQVASIAKRPAWPSRRFHLLVHDGDVASAANYVGVNARLVTTGKYVQVYVDERDLAGLNHEMVQETVKTFDERIYPVSSHRFGAVEDVDGDGRFTIFLSGWLDRLAGGRHKVDGFVRGADFDLELGAPFGNRCDMMYLSTSMRVGPHLRTVLAHEYAHAVRFSRKAFPRSTDGRLGIEEEGWLDEGLAHLVEDLHGFSRSNVDYRVSAFLSRPERYRLVVDDYYAADLFRSHGNRGGTYLFLRWCVDRYGDAVLDRMMTSPYRGIANLEAATGRNFASLYRDWTVALFLTGLDPNAVDKTQGHYRSLDPRGMIEEWILAGPRSEFVQADGHVHKWLAGGTTTHYVVLESTEPGGVAVEVDGPTNAQLQVTAVALPDELGRVDLDIRAVASRDGNLQIKAKLSAIGKTAIRIGAVAWEPLVPAADARASVFRHAGLDMLGIARRFGTSGLERGGRLASGPIPLGGVKPGDGPLVFKVVGTDAAGRRVAAWADLEIVAEEAAEPDVGLSGQ